MYTEANDVLQRLKVNVNSVYQKVESLSGGRQQSVAIARAISFNPKVVILDEPTANLSHTATETLLKTMLELKAQGVAQVIISHRLVDIFAVGDRIMVLKRGENVGDRYVKHTSETEILELMIAGASGDRGHGRRGAGRARAHRPSLARQASGASLPGLMPMPAVSIFGSGTASHAPPWSIDCSEMMPGSVISSAS